MLCVRSEDWKIWVFSFLGTNWKIWVQWEIFKVSFVIINNAYDFFFKHTVHECIGRYVFWWSLIFRTRRLWQPSLSLLLRLGTQTLIIGSGRCSSGQSFWNYLLPRYFLFKSLWNLFFFFSSFFLSLSACLFQRDITTANQR